MMKRFLLSVAVGVLCGCVDFATLEKAYAERGVVEKVGVLAHLDISWPNSTAALRRALAFYRAEGVAAVVVLGDPTLNGYANQREVFRTAWREAFRGTTEPQLVLAEDPYAYAGISFTGQGRYPLTDLLCVQPPNGRTINAGSLHGIEVSKLFAWPDPRVKAAFETSAQGLLVLKRETGLTVRRMDFADKAAEDVGPAWEVDASGLVRDAEGGVVPEFWNDTTIAVVRGYDRVGNVIYTVRWPPVLARHTGARAFNYDVLVGKKVLRRVQSPAFHRPESRETAAISCVIAEAELDGAPPRFGVTPISSLGLSGKTVWSR